MMRLINKYLLFVLSFLIFSGISVAQTGKIAGNVTDKETGNPLPFVNVLITGTNIGAATDVEGHYNILNVAPGTYSVKASAIGYNSVTYTDVRVSIDLTSEIDFELSPESIRLSEDIVVVAKKELVTKDLTSSTSIIGSEELSTLPVTEFKEALQLQAGFVGGSVRGGRRGEVLYTIDGVSVTDLYDSSTVVEVNTSAIQEMQFISGAFNAEYGKALSGVVNLATKEGRQEFSGSLTLYSGDNLSNNTGIFRGVDNFDPVSTYNVETSLSGSVWGEYLTFFLNGRFYHDDGYIYGQRIYNPWDITRIVNYDATGPEKYDIEQTGDGELVPMNNNEKTVLHSRFSSRPLRDIKLSLTTIYNKERFKEYSHEWTLDPDGDLKRRQHAYTGILSLTHTLSSSTFYRLNTSYFYKKYRHFVYEDINDPRQVHTRLTSQEPQESPSFNTGGARNEMFSRTTSSLSFKIDITSQLTNIHQAKFGVEMSRNRLSFDDFALLQWKDLNSNGYYDPGEEGIADPQESGDPYVLMRRPNPYDPNDNLAINLFTTNPVELSAYIQDKIELEDVIVNAGIRVDYFHPDGKVLNDPTDPDIYRPRKEVNKAASLDERRAFWYSDATDKFKISPRIGFAFPITARGVVHFSYGHFFQVPKYNLLYANPEYKFGYTTGNIGIAGNPDLEPEETISGELGLQQAIFSDVVIDVTAYFRNIKNLTGTRADEIIIYGGSSRYSRYVNSDFGFVKGLIFTLDKKFGASWGARLDYTLQSAKGNASDPDETRNQLVNGEQPEIQLVSLAWDQTHTVNLSVSYASQQGWGGSVLFQYGSGFPYTPSQSMSLSKLLDNSEKKPATFNTDLKLYYDINLLNDFKLSLFGRIYNLFDTHNQLHVYNDSGTADFTLNEYLRSVDEHPDITNSLSEFYRNPLYYSEPRRVEVGFTFNF